MFVSIRLGNYFVVFSVWEVSRSIEPKGALYCFTTKSNNITKRFAAKGRSIIRLECVIRTSGAALLVSDILTFLGRRVLVGQNFLCGQRAVVDAHLIE
jgi:hypothetical protein